MLDQIAGIAAYGMLALGLVCIGVALCLAAIEEERFISFSHAEREALERAERLAGEGDGPRGMP